jgi:hypothetical protein
MKMQQNICIQLSTKDKNYDPDKNVQFTVRSYKVKDLQQVFQSTNYSPIQWKAGRRVQENFFTATGFTVDIDDKNNISIDAAVDRLRSAKLNYALITSKRHTPEVNRFHIFLPFNRIVRSEQDYDRVVNRIVAELFPECDPNVKESARYIFGSPEDAIYRACWDQNNFDVDGGNQIVSEAWDANLRIRTSKEVELAAVDVIEKTIIYCPFHEDSNPSAWLDYAKQSDNQYIHCSACGKTYWKVDQVVPLEKLCVNYWSYGLNLFEIGIINSKFFIEKNSEKKIYVRTNAITPEERNKVYKYLVEQKHIAHLVRVNHMGDMGTDKSYYSFEPASGELDVHYSAPSVKLQQNQFIENYLSSVFGEHTTFIKEFLAMYCYTNYTKLPTLILKGDRGCGKNTFAEMVAKIFPSLSRMWKGEEGAFNPEVEMKLLIADETVTDDPRQYKMLKKYAGSEFFEVNEKFMKRYQVKNNLNMMLLSNAMFPIYVKRDEEPNDERENQFFVYEFKKFKGDVDLDLRHKLADRLGYYVRTELKKVFDNISTSGNRYNIRVPITDEEKSLFVNNATDVETMTDKFIQWMVMRYNDQKNAEFIAFVGAMYLPTDFFDCFIVDPGVSKKKVIKSLVERKYLKSTVMERRTVNKNKRYVFQMTPELQDLIMEKPKKTVKTTTGPSFLNLWSHENGQSKAV